MSWLGALILGASYAIDKAFEDGPGDICAHCSGGSLMRQNWSRELSDDSLDLQQGQPAAWDITTTVEKVED